jgi:hypothetical protein
LIFSAAGQQEKSKATGICTTKNQPSTIPLEYRNRDLLCQSPAQEQVDLAGLDGSIWSIS